MGDQEHYQMYIGGEWLPASSGQTFESINIDRYPHSSYSELMPVSV